MSLFNRAENKRIEYLVAVYRNELNKTHNDKDARMQVIKEHKMVGDLNGRTMSYFLDGLTEKEQLEMINGYIYQPLLEMKPDKLITTLVCLEFPESISNKKLVDNIRTGNTKNSKVLKKVNQILKSSN